MTPGIIEKLRDTLKKQAGPWKQELKDSVEDISTCVDDLVSTSRSLRRYSAEKFDHQFSLQRVSVLKSSERISGVLRHTFRPLYESLALPSLQLSVALFTEITREKILREAELQTTLGITIFWDSLAADLLSGVLVCSSSLFRILCNPNVTVFLWSGLSR